uniref:Phosphatidylinositol specific phospholipase C X domain containing 1 n=1 Tax=Catagonus wagneri TaxID=51154 RepID=A0A8C3YE71_9CETA
MSHFREYLLSLSSVWGQNPMRFPHPLACCPTHRSWNPRTEAPGPQVCPDVSLGCPPGSHDTMTYCLNKKSPISHNESRLLQLLGKILPCVTLPVVLRWSTTQVLNVTEQLDAGVRYLDLRIAHVAEGSRRNLHFVHMVYTTALVEDTLTEISEWLENHPREVVVLACRDFEGVTEDLHEYLVACIKNVFGDMLCPRGVSMVTPSLRGSGEIRESEADTGRHREGWPRGRDCGHQPPPLSVPGGLFVAGINLTENLEYVLGHLAGSLERMTLPSLPYLDAWVRAQCPGPGARCTNIIAGDFIGADTFVSDVIRLNEKLLQG